MKSIYLFKSLDPYHVDLSMTAIVSGATEHYHATARAAGSEEPPSTILHSVMRYLPLGSADQLTKSESLLRSIRRQRQTIPTDPDNKLPNHLTLTERTENFLLHEEKELIIFMMDSNLSMLKKCKKCFSDGTFKVKKVFDLS